MANARQVQGCGTLVWGKLRVLFNSLTHASHHSIHFTSACTCRHTYIPSSLYIHSLFRRFPPHVRVRLHVYTSTSHHGDQRLSKAARSLRIVRSSPHSLKNFLMLIIAAAAPPAATRPSISKPLAPSQNNSTPPTPNSSMAAAPSVSWAN